MISYSRSIIQRLQMDVMGVIIFLSGCSGSSVHGPNTVEAFIGEMFTVTCYYDTYYTNYEKYWCKGENWKNCMILIETTGSEEEIHKGRYSIKDNHTSHSFSINVYTPQKTDSGFFWCGINKYMWDKMTKIEINLSALPSTVKISATTFTTLPTTTATLTASVRYSPLTSHSSAFGRGQSQGSRLNLMYFLLLLSLKFPVIILVLAATAA
ncbi:CMRF35-like molecule 3 [Protopterus annectens]|uniref:CMRF35-like molecule 3 n=1 Tax=Protopterus annectens TaxID=7888 RepID=UPI001CFA7249|nr:CMRF35-like molecule 3 [Protopterus annectens]XP_043940923.1 CMRF35-like molecule 3 [Protopterus annectens]